jgi:hypothetical protein
MSQLGLQQTDTNLWENFDGSILAAQLPEGDILLSRLNDDSLMSVRFSRFDRSIGALLESWMVAA